MKRDLKLLFWLMLAPFCGLAQVQFSNTTWPPAILATADAVVDATIERIELEKWEFEAPGLRDSALATLSIRVEECLKGHYREGERLNVQLFFIYRAEEA